MELKSAVAEIGRPDTKAERLWTALPGTGPAPALRRRVIARVPASRMRKLRWDAGTVVPGVGPTARIRRELRSHRGALIGAGVAATGAAVAIAKRRSHEDDSETAGDGQPAGQ